MYNTDRSSEQYLNGLAEFMIAATAHRSSRGQQNICCPCIDCKNLVNFNNSDQIQEHLIRRGFTQGYTCWTSHGEHHSAATCSDATEDTFDGRHVMPDDTPPDEADDIAEMLEHAEGNMNRQEYEEFKVLMCDSEKPLFVGCKTKYTKLVAVIQLLKLKATNAWSDKSFTELLTLLADMLPEGNELPTSTYRAKKVLCPLGMEIERIHACKNDCVLFRKQYADLQACPVCKAPRYKRKEWDPEDVVAEDGAKKGSPAKVMWYLPIIPRLRRLFRNPREAELLRWHDEERKKDGKLRHPADSIQWRNIDRKYPDFGEEPRNIRFGLSSDGMNPFGSMSSRHSTWPVMLCIYNLPPWLCMKRKYIMMCSLIQGPKQPGNNIYVYLQPLMEDLVKLWVQGEDVYDAYKGEHFNMRGLLFCTMNDLPALANLSG